MKDLLDGFLQMRRILAEGEFRSRVKLRADFWVVGSVDYLGISNQPAGAEEHQVQGVARVNKGWKVWEKAGASGEVAKVFKGLHTKSKLVVSLSPSSSCKACRAAPKSPGPTKPTISAEEGLTKRRKSRPHHQACRPPAICFHLKYASCCADNPHWCPPWL